MSISVENTPAIPLTKNCRPFSWVKPAGLKWIESISGGSAVTAWPNDNAFGLPMVMLSVNDACVIEEGRTRKSTKQRDRVETEYCRSSDGVRIKFTFEFVIVFGCYSGRRSWYLFICAPNQSSEQDIYGKYLLGDFLTRFLCMRKYRYAKRNRRSIYWIWLEPAQRTSWKVMGSTLQAYRLSLHFFIVFRLGIFPISIALHYLVSNGSANRKDSAFLSICFNFRTCQAKPDGLVFLQSPRLYQASQRGHGRSW